MVRRWFCDVIALIAIGLAAAACQTYSVREGDLLFHVARQSNAITDVTPDMIDHVAIALGADSVIEAVGRGVVVTPLDSLRRQDGYYLIGRVRRADRRRSVLNARQYVGRAYDYVFMPDNADIYCSELVQLSFVDRRGQRLFGTIPMSFHDSTGRVTDYWLQYYGRRGLPVPEGHPGTNPAELSRRAIVSILSRRLAP